LDLWLRTHGHLYAPALKNSALLVETGTGVTDTIKQVLDRIRGLKQFVVRVPVPEEFQFSGAVPFDMEIVGRVAMVTVWALTQKEAQQRAEEFFQNTP
jgi:hypothetical protein